MIAEALRALRVTLWFALFTGLIYSLAITGAGQLIFPSQANGSLIVVGGQVVGSSLIGQNFSADRYFQGRWSANNYDPSNSCGSNLGPDNKALIDRVASSARSYRNANGLDPNAQVPVDAVTADFSGFDPDITEANALLQVDRVAKARSLDTGKVRVLVERYAHPRILWIFGEPYVNVLEVNLALDRGEAS